MLITPTCCPQILVTPLASLIANCQFCKLTTCSRFCKSYIETTLDTLSANITEGHLIADGHIIINASYCSNGDYTDITLKYVVISPSSFLFLPSFLPSFPFLSSSFFTDYIRQLAGVLMNFQPSLHRLVAPTNIFYTRATS